MASQSDLTGRIERNILINASRERVWRALADTGEFGRWFGVDIAGQRFAPGERVRGPITLEGYTHVMFDVLVEQVVPHETLSWRWHPYAIDPKVDYSQEQRTRVTFTLKDAPGGATLLSVEESGFDGVPPARRLEAFRMNDGGWEAQLENIRAHAAPQ